MEAVMVKQATGKLIEVSEKEPVKRDDSQARKLSGDELISALANSYENRRARQVYEWELLRRKSYQSVAR